MTNKTYLTVKEASEILGVSRQGIYKRMKTDLSTYVVLVDKTKCLKYKALERFYVNDSTKSVESLSALNAIKKMVEILEKENDLKQQTIDRLEERNAEEHRQLVELTSKVGNALDSVTKGHLAETLLEGKKLMEGGNPQADLPPKKLSLFQRIFNRPSSR